MHDDILYLNVTEIPGGKELEWVWKNMDITRAAVNDSQLKKIIRGKKILVCLHLEPKTCACILALSMIGAQIYLCAANTLSTKDIAVNCILEKSKENKEKSLGEEIICQAKYGMTWNEYEEHIRKGISWNPDWIMDDGAEIIKRFYYYMSLPFSVWDKNNILGASEQTTTGINIIKGLLTKDKKKILKFPLVGINEAKCKYLFDNNLGTASSVWQSIQQTLHMSPNGKTVVIIGYGHCGRNLAKRAKDLQASRVIVTEINKIKALEAHMNGYEVMPLNKASFLGDIFITSTGEISCLRKEHIQNMKDKAILCNAGHENGEIDINYLESLEKISCKENIDIYKINGKKIFLLAGGNLVNIASGDGHPTNLFDMTMALHICSLSYILNSSEIKEGLIMPEDIDEKVSDFALETHGIKID